MLILEYVEKGALNMYLRKFRKQNTYLPVWRLMKMISDVAQVGIVAESGHHLKFVKWFTIEWNKTEAIFPIAQTFALLQHHLWLSFKTSQNALIWYDNVEPDKEILGCSFKHGCNVFFLQKWLVYSNIFNVASCNWLVDLWREHDFVETCIMISCWEFSFREWPT